MEKIRHYLIGLTGLLAIGDVACIWAQPLPMEVSRLRQSSAPMLSHEIEAPVLSGKITDMPESKTINTLTFYPGSLKENIQRIAKECGWGTVVWQTPYDYNWTGTTHFIDSYLPEILNKVLYGYPLQAVFYQGNHILVITPRNLS